jgi:hypothetical protein
MSARSEHDEREALMNAMAHNSTVASIDRVINLWPEDPAEDTLEMGLRQRAALLSATGVALGGCSPRSFSRRLTTL